MFDSKCDIRSEFLSGLKDLSGFGGVDKNEQDSCLFFEKIDLPKKEGIFQHVPLYSLYQNKFALSKEGKVKKSDIKDQILKDAEHSHLVFVNGVFDLSVSDISNCQDLIEIEEKNFFEKDNRSLRKEYNFFMPLNLALSKRELHIKVKERAVLTSPLQLLNVITEEIDDYSLFSPRIFITFNQNSMSSLCLSGCNLSKNKCFWMNQAVYLDVQNNAIVNFSSAYPVCNKAYLFHLIRANVKKEGELNIFSAMEGAKIEHHDVRVSLDEEEARCNVGGMFLLKESLQAHLNINIEHKAKNTQFDQLIKGVLKDSSRSSFEATVSIDKKAKKSVSRQLNKNLLLSEKAQAFSKPFLKVFADDVKASHGATMYRLNEDHLFYLTSRGISFPEASYLLIKGFCKEIINLVNIKNVKEILEDRIIHYLG